MEMRWDCGRLIEGSAVGKMFGESDPRLLEEIGHLVSWMLFIALDLISLKLREVTSGFRISQELD